MFSFRVQDTKYKKFFQVNNKKLWVGFSFVKRVVLWYNYPYKYGKIGMPEESASIVEKMLEAYKKYAPRNITFSQFTDMIEKDPSLLREIENGTLGNFSTFNVKLARRFKQLERENVSSRDDFRNLLRDSLDEQATEKATKEIAKIYEKIICADDAILVGAWTFETLTKEQKQKLAVHIINGLNKYFNIAQEHLIDVDYTDGAINRLPKDSFSYNIHMFIQNFLTKIWPEKRKHGRYGGYMSNANKKMVLAYTQYFETFIDTISHEYGHFIDYRYPNLGMLGSQISHYGRYVYESQNGYERYRANPTEYSSFKIGEFVGNHIKTILKEQAKKKPILYKATIQAALDKAEADFAGLKMKAEKASIEYLNIRYKIRKRYFKFFEDLTEKEQEKIWEEIDKDPRLKDFQKIKDEYFDAVNKIKKERYPSFYDLSDEEQERIDAEIDKDPRLQGLEEAKEKYYDILYKTIYEKYPDYSELLYEEQEKIRETVKQIPEVVECWQRYDSLVDLHDSIRRERFPSFYDFSEEERDRITEEIKQIPLVAELYQRYSDMFDLRYKIRIEKYPASYELSSEETKKMWEKVDKHPLVKLANWKKGLVYTDEYWEKSFTVLHYQEALTICDENNEDNMSVQSERDDR